MDLSERKKIIKENLLFSFENPNKTGGQSCGIMSTNSVIKSEDLGIEIKVNTHRSQHKNRELAMLLMELAIDELVK